MTPSPPQLRTAAPRPIGARAPAPACLAKALAFVLTLGALPAGTGQADSAAAQLMAEAMARMMEAMGLLTPAPAGAPLPPPSMPMPGAGPMQGHIEDWMRQFYPETGPGFAGPWQPAPLEGVWEAAGGGLMVVQGMRYRLYAPDWRFVDGTLQVTGERLRLTNPQAGIEMDFEYALDQGRLVLRDSSGQMYLYRQVILDGGSG